MPRRHAGTRVHADHARAFDTPAIGKAGVNHRVLLRFGSAIVQYGLNASRPEIQATSDDFRVTCMPREWGDRVPEEQCEARVRRDDCIMRIAALIFAAFFFLGIWATFAG